MRLRVPIYGVAATLGLASCGSSRTVDQPSLVDAQNVVSESGLKNEIIVIFREAPGGEAINYELHPDDRLLVTHHHREAPQQRLLGEESFALRAEHADRSRRLLWRLRPDNDAPAERSLPRGCVYVTDRQPEMAVGFSRDHYSRLEQFSLPSEEQCQSPAARQARALLMDVLRSFPESKIDERHPLQS